jgi:hypothetical protein
MRREMVSVAKYHLNVIDELCVRFVDHGIVKDECVMEYKQYKRLVVGSYPKANLAQMCATLHTKYTDEMPNLTKLLRICVIIPMLSVTCERGFSTQNRIKTRLRTNLNNKTLNDLMRLSEDGPEMIHFNFERAMMLWKGSKTRRVFSHWVVMVL